jgi:hypothetical protein
MTGGVSCRSSAAVESYTTVESVVETKVEEATQVAKAVTTATAESSAAAGVCNMFARAGGGGCDGWSCDVM